MIHVERAGEPYPAHLTSKEVKNEQNRTKRYFLSKRERLGQERYDFKTAVWQHPEVEAALDALFAGKCAYCESPRESPSESLIVEHFRPKSDAQNLDGRVDPDDYWWLAYEWENLYLCCRLCSLNKGIRFPVVSGTERAPTGCRGNDLAREEDALLIDPCFDRPEDYLHFNEDGTVEPVQGDTLANERGNVTIEILGLNRTELLKKRRLLADEVLRSWESFIDASREPKAQLDAIDELTRLSNTQQAYSGMVRQLILRRLADVPMKRFKPLVRGALKDLERRLEQPIGRRKKPAAQVPAPSPARPVPKIGYLNWVKIENFRAIRTLELEFTDPGDGSAGWKVLLGENGTGKSSVLQAVALTLIGREELEPEKLERRGMNPTKVLHRQAEKGRVEVVLTTGTTLELEFDREGFHGDSQTDELQILTRGYGATRLLPRTASQAGAESDRSGASRCHVENLFNPFFPLRDAAQWFSSLASQDQFDRAALAVKDLLRLQPGDHLRKDPESGRVVIVTGEDGLALELDQLSDGYQSALALTADILAGAPEGLHDLQNMPGIVLLDEIGAHLHPRWRMEIVASLRRVFPRVQFLATTHEPLCLRGLKKGEIDIMDRDDTGRIIRVDAELPSPEGMRVDQLLTSHFFGLHSTIDPEIDKKFQEYYALLADPSSDDAIRKRRERLKGELASHCILGATRRDQLVYEVIDEVLAAEPSLSLEQRRKRRDETKEIVKAIWSSIDLKDPRTR